MTFVQALIDMNSPWAKQIAEGIQYIGFMRGGRKWMFVAFLFEFLWVLLFYLRRKNDTNSWLRRDALFMGCILTGVFLMRIPVLAYAHLDVDESDWLVGAATFYRDPYFWLSVDGTTSGPLSIIPLSLIPLFGGTLSYFSVRLFALLVYLLPGLLFTYLGLRNMCGRPIADMIIIPLAGIVALAQNLNAYNGEFPILFLTALSFYLYSITYKGRYTGAFYWLAGFVVGLFAYSKPQAIPVGAIIALCYLWKLYAQQQSRTVSTLFVVGGLSPSILVSLYLTATGLWTDFINSYIVNNLFYGGAEGAFGNPYSLGTILSKMLDYLISQPEYTFWMLTGLVSFLVGTAAVLTQRKVLGKELSRELVVALAVLGVAFYCTIKPHTFFYHYQNMLLVPIAWLAGVVTLAAYGLVKNLGMTRANLSSLGVGVAVPVFFLMTLVISSIQAIGHTIAPSQLIGGKGDIRSKEARIIAQYADPNEKLAVWGWNTPLFVDTQLLQGTRDGHTHYHMSPIKLQDYYLERYVSDLKRNKPKVVVETFQGYSALTFGADGRQEFGLENYPIVYNYVKEHYVLKEDIGGMTRVFVRKPIPASVPAS
jgi:hypothetical protein